MSSAPLVSARVLAGFFCDALAPAFLVALVEAFFGAEVAFLLALAAAAGKACLYLTRGHDEAQGSR